MVRKTYYCKKCKYTTEKKFNFNKHCKTKKHIDNDLPPVSGEDTPISGAIPPVAGVISSKYFICEYCRNEFLFKHKSRHYSRCKTKQNLEVKSEIKELQKLTSKLKKELEKKDEKIDEIEKDMFDFMKSMVKMNQTTNITNNTNNTNSNNKINNNNYNMYYIINNYKNAENIEDVLESPLTQEELDYIDKNGSLLGSYNVIKGRCVTDKDLSKRPVHCTDFTRKKYLLRYKNEWIVDPRADKLLTMTFNKMKNAYDLECEDLNERITNTQELLKLDIDGRKKLNTQIGKDVLLKNNIN